MYSCLKLIRNFIINCMKILMKDQIEYYFYRTKQKKLVNSKLIPSISLSWVLNCIIPQSLSLNLQFLTLRLIKVCWLKLDWDYSGNYLTFHFYKYSNSLILNKMCSESCYFEKVWIRGVVFVCCHDYICNFYGKLFNSPLPQVLQCCRHWIIVIK